MTLKTTITGMGVLLVLITLSSSLLILFTLGSSMETELEELGREQAERELDIALTDVRNMISVENESLLKVLEGHLNIARDAFSSLGRATLSTDTIQWDAINQITKESVAITLPRMMAGDEWLGQNREFSRSTPVVDVVGDLVGSTCTVFQRMNEAGDMLRVATNVRKSDGTRAIGTFIPSDSPVVQTLLEGRTFRGTAFVVNAWYLTVYEPIKDASGKVIGALYVGILQENVQELAESIRSNVVGQSGHTFILGGKGNEYARYRVHGNTSLQGEFLDQDTPWGQFLKGLLDQALDNQGSRSVFATTVDDQGREVACSALYFPAWDWTIVGVLPLEDVRKVVDSTRASLNSMRNWMLGVAAAIAILGSLASWLISSNISRRLLEAIAHQQEIAEGNVNKDVPAAEMAQKNELGMLARSQQRMVESIRTKAEVADHIASGDLTVVVTPDSDQDTLGKALHSMVRRLSEILAQVHATASQVEAGSTLIAESSQILSKGASTQAASLEQVAMSVDAVGSKTRESADNATTASSMAAESRLLVEKGAEEMQRMVAAMDDINQASTAIDKIIKTIDEIAFQTNLLALNAAVEAARAGSHGKGFAVVAEEVRNLAVRSARAAGETAELIQSTIEKVRNGNTIANESSEALMGIMQGNIQVSDLLETIAANAHEQDQGMQTIITGLQQLDQVTEANTASAEEAAASSKELSELAESLNTLLGQFVLTEGTAGVMNIQTGPRQQPRQSETIRKAQEYAPAHQGNSVTPSQVISLDDESFGKY